MSGSNFRMNEFSASVLRVQLARLDSQIDVREQRVASALRPARPNSGCGSAGL
jgi:dTDP-4-amino-4,6-dideoxygalactose transaminase